MTNIVTKSNVEDDRGYFLILATVYHGGKSGQGLTQEPEAEIMEGLCLLAYFQYHAYLAFS